MNARRKSAPGNSSTWRRHSPAGATLRDRMAERLVPDGLWRKMAAARIRRVHGSGDIAPGRNELVVVCLLRDGMPHIRDFIEHHFGIGAKHLVFLDNGSTDGTVEALSEYEDGVTVLETRLPYRDYCLLMKQYLMQEFGSGGWVLCADIDERFAYPFGAYPFGAYPSQGDGTIAKFVSYLDDGGYTAVAAHMLDLFPTGSLAGSGRLEEQTYYDLSDISAHEYNPAFGRTNNISNADIRLLRGGIRKALFGVNAGLTKHPLVKMDGKTIPMANSSHKVRNARLADFSTVLLHYKFLGDFRSHVARAVREENYYDSSAEYRKYLAALERDSGLSAENESIRKLGSIDELVENGFLVVSPEYRRWMTGREKGG